MRATRNCMNFHLRDWVFVQVLKVTTSTGLEHWQGERCVKDVGKFTFSRWYQPLIDSGSLVTIPKKGHIQNCQAHEFYLSRCWCLLKTQKVGPFMTDFWLNQSWRITNSWCFQKKLQKPASSTHSNWTTTPTRKPRVVAMRRLLPHSMLSLIDCPDFGET